MPEQRFFDLIVLNFLIVNRSKEVKYSAWELHSIEYLQESQHKLQFISEFFFGISNK